MKKYLFSLIVLAAVNVRAQTSALEQLRSEATGLGIDVVRLAPAVSVKANADQSYCDGLDAKIENSTKKGLLEILSCCEIKADLLGRIFKRLEHENCEDSIRDYRGKHCIGYSSYQLDAINEPSIAWNTFTAAEMSTMILPSLRPETRDLAQKKWTQAQAGKKKEAAKEWVPPRDPKAPRWKRLPAKDL